MTSEIQYLGDLRTKATHLQSKVSIITDAPVDNQGKGEAFSPTDLVATALASCMLTIMGIKARDMEINLEGINFTVNKIMGIEPRRITEIEIAISIPSSLNLSDKEKIILEKTALTCPVAKSLDSAIKQNVTFSY